MSDAMLLPFLMFSYPSKTAYIIKNSENASEFFYEKPIAKLPFFVFFLVTENMIAARGKGGGLALWVKEN